LLKVTVEKPGLVYERISPIFNWLANFDVIDPVTVLTPDDCAENVSCSVPKGKIPVNFKSALNVFTPTVENKDFTLSKEKSVMIYHLLKYFHLQ